MRRREKKPAARGTLPLPTLLGIKIPPYQVFPVPSWCQGPVVGCSVRDRMAVDPAGSYIKVSNTSPTQCRQWIFRSARIVHSRGGSEPERSTISLMDTPNPRLYGAINRHRVGSWWVPQVFLVTSRPPLAATPQSLADSGGAGETGPDVWSSGGGKEPQSRGGLS